MPARSRIARWLGGIGLVLLAACGAGGGGGGGTDTPTPPEPEVWLLERFESGFPTAGWANLSGNGLAADSRFGFSGASLGVAGSCTATGEAGYAGSFPIGEGLSVECDLFDRSSLGTARSLLKITLLSATNLSPVCSIRAGSRCQLCFVPVNLGECNTTGFLETGACIDTHELGQRYFGQFLGPRDGSWHWLKVRLDPSGLLQVWWDGLLRGGTTLQKVLPDDVVLRVTMEENCDGLLRIDNLAVFEDP